MEKIVKYEMSLSEHDHAEKILGLMEYAIDKETNRLQDIVNKTNSDVIALNNTTYLKSMLRELTRLL